MRFEVLEVSIDSIRALRQPLERIRTRDRSLFEQIRDAASSVPLNIAEGRQRIGRDRSQHYRVATGSADEARAGLRVALMWGYVSSGEVAESLQLLDRVVAMLWRLTH